jgi:hypothetical protein
MDAAEQPQQADSELEAIIALDETLTSTVTDDVSAALAEEFYPWEIPTGKVDAEGRPVYLRVKVQDPKRTELPAQYLQALQTKGHEAAAIGLWQACIMEPVSLKNPATYHKTTTAFRSTLTYRLLNLAGVNGDFFGAMLSMGSRQGSRPAATSSTKSPTSTASTPAPSTVTSTPSSSTGPSTTPSEPVSVSVPSS